MLVLILKAFISVQNNLTMSLDIGSQIIKVILFLFNSIWFLFGVAILVVGILVHKNTGLSIDGDQSIGISLFSIILISLGIIIIIVSFSGCYGTLKESRCMIITHIALHFIILVVEITIGVYLYINLKNNTLEELMEKIFKNAKLFDLVDVIHKYFKCCGINGAEFWRKEGHSIPVSCSLNNESFEQMNFFQEGCAKVVGEFFEEHKSIIWYSALGLELWHLVTFVLSYSLAKNMRN